jgi:ABC-type antimicrobial peptide transport system permease subunit
VSKLLANTLILIAVGLAAVGLYAVTAYAVAQRTQEIGIRVALGAQPQQVRWLVLRRAMGQLGLGLIFGLALTVAWQIVFGTTSGSGAITDPLNLTSAAVLLVVVSAFACLPPIRRATRLDPVIALRYE